MSQNLGQFEARQDISYLTLGTGQQPLFGQIYLSNHIVGPRRQQAKVDPVGNSIARSPHFDKVVEQLLRSFTTSSHAHELHQSYLT